MKKRIMTMVLSLFMLLVIIGGPNIAVSASSTNPIVSGKYYIVNSAGEAINQSGGLTSYGSWGDTNIMLVEYDYNTGYYTIRANSYLTNKQYQMYMRPGNGYSGQTNRIYPHPYTSLYQAGNEVFWNVEVINLDNKVFKFINCEDNKTLTFNPTEKYAYTNSYIFVESFAYWQLIPA